ncbi:MAG: heavy metal-binding domain-containing protein, partial [Woeseiaceae bacterium]
MPTCDHSHRQETPNDLRDPVCGMTVTPNSDHHFEHAGSAFYFCCAGCRNKFATDPEFYLNRSLSMDAENVAAPAGPGPYICPMCPEVREDEPVPCPVCGMALESEALPALQTKTQYTCPMHPEIAQETPGECPDCGMALEPVTVAPAEEENPELIDMTRRLGISTLLAVPVLLLAMGEMVGLSFDWLASQRALTWLELAFATPVVLWCGWP